MVCEFAETKVLIVARFPAEFGASSIHALSESILGGGGVGDRS